MHTLVDALALGVMAGLALALPVGPVSLLVVHEGLTRGFRVAAGAALGVATVDAVYATVATTAGGGVARALDGHVAGVRVVSALALGVVAVIGLTRTLAPRPRKPGTPSLDGALSPIADSASASVRGLPTFARFVALTAVNPLTALAFASVALALAPRLEGSGRAAFVMGVVAASGAWQITLAAAGSLVGARLGPRVRTGLSLVGHAAVVVLAVVVAVA